MSVRPPVRLAALLGAVCVLGGTAAFVTAADTEGPPDAVAQALARARRDGRPVVVFRDLEPGASGRVALTGLGDAQGERRLSPLRCARVYVAPSNGLCVAREGASGSYQARVLDANLRVRHVLDVAGSPSRARISPDGRYGAVTLFVSGHAYETRGISTETTLIDLGRGTRIGQLEQFTTSRAGRQVTAEDANFWGVTFARDSDRFYATLATGGRTYLVEGSVSARTMHTIHENVECPSLSPDGTRIAYKKRVATGDDPWRLTVLDLASGRETPVSETRSVDDQVEWLDEDHLLYGLDDQIRMARADGGGRPAPFRHAAASPAVVRW